MTTAFRDFLRQQAEKHQAEAKANKALVDDWRAAVERLFTQMRGWLKEDDPEGVIQIEDGQEDITEPGLGRYSVPRMDLHAFGKWIGIIPKARKTVGTAKPPQQATPQRATGRVDITDELRRYVLYRTQQDGRDVWLIDDLDSGQQPLDQGTFEKALMSYLR